MTRDKKKALHLLVKSFPNVDPAKFRFWLTGESGYPFDMAVHVAQVLEEDIFMSFLFEPEIQDKDRKAFLFKMLEQNA